MASVEAQGKSFEFKYIPANLYIQARKVLREMNPYFMEVQLAYLDDAHSDDAKNAEALAKYLEHWTAFCKLIFVGPDMPLDISLNDADRIVSDFLAQARPGAKKPEP